MSLENLGHMKNSLYIFLYVLPLKHDIHILFYFFQRISSKGHAECG